MQRFILFDAKLHNEAIEPGEPHSFGIQFFQRRAEGLLISERGFGSKVCW